MILIRFINLEVFQQIAVVILLKATHGSGQLSHVFESRSGYLYFKLEVFDVGENKVSGM
jgi:hypothetical protein